MQARSTSFNVTVKDPTHALHGVLGSIERQRTADGKLICDFTAVELNGEIDGLKLTTTKKYKAAFYPHELTIVRVLTLLGHSND